MALALYKNDQIQDVNYVKKQDEGSKFRNMAITCVGIPVKVFAEWFDLDVEYDEDTDQGYLHFYRR